MITAGVDLAAMPKRTALASIEWTDGRAVIKDIICPADDDVIVKAIEQADKTGIDCPLGWPAAFTDFVAAHHAGHVSIPTKAGACPARRHQRPYGPLRACGITPDG